MNQQKWLLSIISGLFFALSWPYITSITPLIFIAFVPLLILEDSLFTNGEKSFWSGFKYSYLAFFIFNILTTFWIYNVDEPIGTKLFSAGSAITLNAAFMAIAFSLFHVTRSRVGSKEGYISILLYWISWEYLHLHWEFSWPWLSLGNVFSIHTNWIQWYEYTGILGGSIFILLINLLFYFAYTAYIKGDNKKVIGRISSVFLLIVLSYLFGKTPLATPTPDANAVEIVLIQPNVNPYTEKFQFESSDAQLLHMLEMAENKMTDKTKVILFPETALQERTTLFMKSDSLILIGLWENNIEASNSVRIIRHFLDDYPHVTLIFGLSSDRIQDKDEEIINASRYIESLDVYYQSYNAALVIAKDRKVEYYHKSKLVPAVEFMPMQWLMKPLMDIVIDMGGTTGTLGTQEEQTPFYTLQDSIAISPAICYESIYGEANGEFVLYGAEILGIITNDGWWGDSPGYKQHLSYAKLRAIETRKWVARSANTGISAFIDPKGDIVQHSEWWVEASLIGNVYSNDILTFYVKHGDYLGRITSFLSVLLLIYTFVNILKDTSSPRIKEST
jgi:apolipoprotein N-acyltransferase